MQNSHFHELKKKEDEERKRKEEEAEKARWTKPQEDLLAEWAEKASCYRWLHSRAEKYYRCRNFAFTIPVIILSTLTGTANFAMDSFVPEERKKMAMGIVGGVNIFAGILSTLQNFLRYAELMEAHRAVSVSWSKFARNITVELALDPKRRKPAGDFLKICRSEFDRLIEQSPLIDDDIIKLFKSSFSKLDVIKPEICNGIHKCKIYERTEQEKVTEIVSDATKKLNEFRKPFRRNSIKSENKLSSIPENSDDAINQNSSNKLKIIVKNKVIDKLDDNNNDKLDDNNNDNNNNGNDNNNDNDDRSETVSVASDKSMDEFLDEIVVDDKK